jgi:DNA-binding GntR family transcriptional regulator
MRSKKRVEASPPLDAVEPHRFVGLHEVEAATATRIVEAITERRLMPGTKLVEDEIARIFGVSRERIRRILLVLSQHGILDIEPNRGAFVAVPTAADRRHAFEMRALIERHVVTTLCQQPPAVRASMCAALRAHIDEETAAGVSRNRALQIKLSGDFHLKLASMAGNSLMLKTLRESMTRMSLALATQHPLMADLDCSINEHLPLVDAIEQGQAGEAVRLMDEHLEHVEQHLRDPASTTSLLERAFNVQK